ncbi:MAG: hypothetical protein IJC40_05985 [Muribaculaceae bacterium]|nr:hypothetical protein [Muribaculaceae bacterium]
MKKSIKLMLGFILCVLAVSCGQPTVADIVEGANEEIAGKTEDGITYESITLEGKDIVFKCKVNDFNFAQIGGVALFESAMAQTFDTSVIENAFAGDENSEKELKIIVDEGCNMVFKFIDSNGDVAKYTITNAQLKEAL